MIPEASCVQCLLLLLAFACTQAKQQHPQSSELFVCLLQQYWIGSGSWKYVPVATFAEAFKQHKTGKQSVADLAVPFEKSPASKEALVDQRFSLSSKPYCSHILYQQLTSRVSISHPTSAPHLPYEHLTSHISKTGANFSACAASASLQQVV